MNYKNLTLEKGLYDSEKSFTQALEELDPSIDYKNTELDGLDAYERQLKRFDIKVAGENSDTISKFFSTTQSAALFPEYVSRAVKQGFVYNDKLSKIIATTTNVDSYDYRSIAITNLDETDISSLGEAETISEVAINLQESLTTLRKYGRMITATYESLKFQRLDLFTIALKKLGNSISNLEFKKAVDTLAATKTEADVKLTSGLTYDGLVELWSLFSPYTMTTIIASKNTVSDLLKLEEFRDANAGLDFHGTGKLITPFGAEIVIANIDDGKIIAIDKNYALEKVQAGGISTEHDKLINRQIERAVIFNIVGFSVIYNDAIKVLTY